MIDEIVREPWRRPPLERETVWTSLDGDYIDELEQELPEPGSADDLRQLIASRVVLLHSERPADREAMIVLAEEQGVAWLLDRWMPGLLSDWKRVGPRIVRLAEVLDVLRRPPDRQTARDLSLRERLRRELMDIDRRLVGLTLLTDRPELLVCGAGSADSAAVREAERADVGWLAPEAAGDDVRFMNCVAACLAAAREDCWPSGRQRAKLVDPMMSRPATVRVDPSAWCPDARADGRHDAIEEPGDVT